MMTSLKNYVPIIFFFLILINNGLADAPVISYRISMPEPHTHYYQVQMEIIGLKSEYLELKMPVWAPGSYLVREFPRNVENFRAFDGKEKELFSEKTNKNTWKIATNKAGNVGITYRVYAKESSVRTSHLDASHGFVHGTSVFMYVEGYKDAPVELEVIPYEKWQKVSTGLKKSDKIGFWYEAENYDMLVDAPIEIGNQKILSFKASGMLCEVAMYGVAEFEEDAIIRDLSRIIETAGKVFMHNPNNYYLFIVHNLDNRGGGLEHHNSTTLQVDRWSYSTPSVYQGFLALAAHEYFHLWWVKRARPIELGPFDYNQENYTTLLWSMEGFTSYYQDLILKRCGIYKENEFLNKLMGRINSIESQPGNQVQSVAMSSFDTWIKFYRPDENSSNSSISYYTKGAVLAALLDLEIIHATRGEKKLDDALRYLYEKYYRKSGRGFTEMEFKEALEITAGRKFDDFFNDYVHGVKPIDYDKYFGYAGLHIFETDITEGMVLGVAISEKQGKVIVESVVSGSAAFYGGINAGDEIIAVDGYRADMDLIDNVLSNKQPGDKINVLVSREGLVRELTVEMTPNKGKKYMLTRMPDSSPAQLKTFNRWLGE